MIAIFIYTILIIVGGWCITDGWFSLSLYLKNKEQTWPKDHYIRVIRILFGIFLWWAAAVVLISIIIPSIIY